MEDTQKKESGGSCGKWVAVILCTVLISGLSAIFIASYFHPQALCSTIHKLSAESQSLFSNEIEWESSEGRRMAFPGSRFAVMKSSDNNCYLFPKQKNGKKSAMVTINAALSEELVEELAGLTTLLYCKGHKTYLVRKLTPNERAEQRRLKKREAKELSQAELTQLNAERQKNHGLRIPYEQRNPRCMDVFIDCGSQVGKINECYTGLMGMFLQQRECLSATSFNVKMWKPPGRILKHMEKLRIQCIVNRRKGLRC